MVMNRTPPPDPNKPECPYMTGLTFKITEHEPPAPSGPGGYPFPTRPFPPETWLEETPESQQVLQYSPPKKPVGPVMLSSLAPQFLRLQEQS
ncbi:hypothetical protein F5Y19DRAFT_423920 [Xylariaceae sp. FL1651]|nr:hypothetical protein F5Y19DRAFT_423920 [Xylariaceae sp. FL1651]